MFHLTLQAGSDPWIAFHVSHVLLPAGPWASPSAGEAEGRGSSPGAAAQELCRGKHGALGGRVEVCDISRHNR